MSFEIAIEFVLSAEGGFSDNPNDTGGATNFGISQWAFNEAKQQNIIDSTVSGVEQITLQDAKNIYRDLFWNDSSLHLNEIDAGDSNLSIALFDFAINSGAGNAVRILQETLGITVDGVLGSKTLNAIYNYQGDLISNYLNGRRNFIDEIVSNDPSQKLMGSDLAFCYYTTYP